MGGHHLAGDTFTSSAGTEGTDFAGGATSAMPLHTAVAADASLAAGKILMLAGRCYKIKEGINDATIGGDIGVKLTETFAGGQLLELYSACVTTITGGNTIKSNTRLDINRGEQLVVGGFAHEDLQVTTFRDVGSLGDDANFDVSKTVLVGAEGSRGGTTTFQYVSQCSNRGTCNSSTGVCKCFKGYSN